MVPKLPDAPYVLQLSRTDTGVALAEYFMRIHSTLADKGLFSPRLLDFLGVKYMQVQSEEIATGGGASSWEEMSAVSLHRVQAEPTHLPTLPEYKLPTLRNYLFLYRFSGKITNETLLDPNARRQAAPGKVIAKDYRAVNYNVWRFYEIVHGGGPVISRRQEEISSPRAYSILQALIMIQSFARCYLARRRRDFLFTTSLSASNVAKEIMSQKSKMKLKDQVDKRLEQSAKFRKQDKLESAARLTQSLWRYKKGYVPEENLERRRHDQEVFARAQLNRRAEDEANNADGMVVADVHPIVHIGNTGIYTVVLGAEEGVPFKLKRVPGGQAAVISESYDVERYKDGSKILKINNAPVASLTFDKIVQRLKTAPFPITLELSRPHADTGLKSLEEIGEINDDQLRIRYGRKTSHPSAIYITETEFYYKKKREEKGWAAVSLYLLRYVQRGNESDTIRARASGKGKVSERFFEIVAESRSYMFELVDKPMEDDSDDDGSDPESKERNPSGGPSKFNRRMDLPPTGIQASPTPKLSKRRSSIFSEMEERDVCPSVS
eukprot:gene290-302_t